MSVYVCVSVFAGTTVVTAATV